MGSTGQTAAPAGGGGLWRDELLLGLLGLSVVAALVYGLVPHAYGILSVAAWAVMGWLQWLQVRMCLAASRIPGIPRSTRRFWRLFVFAAAAFCVSSVPQVVLGVTEPDNPHTVTGGLAHNAVLAVGALFLILALLTSPLGLSTGRERLRFWLDATTVLIAVALFAWQLGDAESTVHGGNSLV